VLERRQAKLIRNPDHLGQRAEPEAREAPGNELRHQQALGAVWQRARIDVLDLAVVRCDARQQVRELRGKRRVYPGQLLGQLCDKRRIQEYARVRARESKVSCEMTDQHSLQCEDKSVPGV
jgi:hypothetical protein